MGELFGMKAQAPIIQQAPPAPVATDAAVVEAQKHAQQRAQMGGRASTFLTNPQAQRDAQPNQQRYLGGK